MVTAEEEQENWAFINACMQTKVSVYLTLHVFIIHQQHGICDSVMETIYYTEIVFPPGNEEGSSVPCIQAQSV